MTVSDADIIITIGSGLVLGSQVLEKIIKEYLDIFDERFVFYGVDTTFCMRIHELGLTQKVRVINGFSHSFSRLSEHKEEKQLALFRKKERGYALGLIDKFYRKKSMCVFLSTLLKLIVKLCFNKNENSIKTYIEAFVKGRHPRS